MAGFRITKHLCTMEKYYIILKGKMDAKINIQIKGGKGPLKMKTTEANSKRTRISRTLGFSVS